jgi:hypothetical protein
MARPSKAVPSRRYQVTLDQPIADCLGAYAEATHRPVSAAAAALIADALNRATTDKGDEFREARRQVVELTAHVQALHRQLRDGAGPDPVEQLAPRWEWPVDVLLADTEWWDRWLPRLNELLGRGRAPLDLLVDEGGYSDLPGFLFPPIVSGERRLTWRSPDYSLAARREDAAGQRSTQASARAHVWEPVIRHVAEALCLLESTAEAGTDPYLRLRAKAEITGPWTRILRYLVGEEEPGLPRRRLA